MPAFPLSRSLGPLGRTSGTPAWWNAAGVTPILAAAAKGVASQAASYVNLVTPGTGDITAGSAPAWDATNGWRFTAASAQWLETGLSPTASWTFLVRYSGVVVNATIFGGTDGTKSVMINPLAGASGIIYRYCSAGADRRVLPTLAAGVLGINGFSGGGWRNGTLDTPLQFPGSYSGTLGATVAIGALRTTTGISSPITANVQAFIVYDVQLNSTQIAAISAAMAAL